VTTAPDAIDTVPPALRNAILAWYEGQGRSLAFRATRDPYAVLVSELMAQQTQAARAAEAWTAWMARFPTAETLAAASPADVLRAWAGLGYNRRALMLHRAAKAIVALHGGRVPDTVEGLMSLPGVGPYTARAVAAIAFGVCVGAVDTNVRRVLGRIAAGDADALGPSAIQALADASVPDDRAGDWTHALMDVGAGPCRSRSPRCDACPAEPWCRCAADGRTSDGRTSDGRTSDGRTSAGRASPLPATASRARRPAAPFPSTNRWLRGRVLARARAAEDGAWSTFGDAIGGHHAPAVQEAVTALGREGMLEVRETQDGIEARLPVG